MTTTDIVLVLEVRICPYDFPRIFAAKPCIQYAQDELFNIIEKGGRMSEASARPYFQQIMYALVSLLQALRAASISDR
jgi:hypothetical protein